MEDFKTKHSNLFVYVEWPLSQQWEEMADPNDEHYDYFCMKYGTHLCSKYDEDRGIYVNKEWYDSFV